MFQYLLHTFVAFVAAEMFAADEVAEEVRPCLVEAVLLGEDEIQYSLQLLLAAVVAVALAVVGSELVLVADLLEQQPFAVAVEAFAVAKRFVVLAKAETSGLVVH